MRGRKLVIELLVMHKNKAYGFQQYTLNLLDYFYAHRDKILYDQIIVVCKVTEKELLFKYADRFAIRSFRVYNNLHRIILQTVLPFTLKLNGDDLLFSPGNTSGLIKRCQEILVIHDLLFKRKEWVSNLFRWQRELYFPISIRKANRIVAISKFTASDLINYYPSSKDKVEVIHSYMNFGKYAYFDNEIKLPNQFFLSVSIDTQYKNLPLILRAFKQYCEAGGNMDLVLITVVNTCSETRRVLNELPDRIRQRVYLKSHISNKELAVLYKKASCFISASLFEGFGMPIVEAMSFGCYVLLSDTAVHREVSFNKGIYFNPHSDEDLSEKMLGGTFLKQAYSAEILEMYSEDRTADRYVELINRL